MNLTELHESTRYEHSHMVAAISGLLAKRAGYSPQEAAVIEQAALLHDIGKNDVPKSILAKPGKLTAPEYELIKTHTQAGCRRITELLRVLSAAAVVAGQHHERQDGSGYLGLIGSQIDPYAQLVAVADVFDALISRRSYKVAWSRNDVCSYLNDRAGRQFDRVIVAVLLAHIDEVTGLYVRPERSSVC